MYYCCYPNPNPNPNPNWIYMYYCCYITASHPTPIPALTPSPPCLRFRGINPMQVFDSGSKTAPLTCIVVHPAEQPADKYDMASSQSQALCY